MYCIDFYLEAVVKSVILSCALHTRIQTVQFQREVGGCYLYLDTGHIHIFLLRASVRKLFISSAFALN